MKGKWGRNAAVAGLLCAALAIGFYPNLNKGNGSGTFTADAVGMGGPEKPVTVTVTVEEGKITEVTAVGEGETPGIGSKAIETLPGQMAEGNTLNVDAVTGATITSNAIKEAAEKALKLAGLNPEDFQTAYAPAAAAEDREIDVDVVVVGAGGAGMSAAITASDAGKSVVILESQSMAGGNTNRAEGGLNAADTKYQDEMEWDSDAGVEKVLKTAETEWADNENVQALYKTVKKQYEDFKANPEGYFDTPELMALDTLIGGHGINDPELLKVLTENSAGAVDFVNEMCAEADPTLKGLVQVGQAGGASVKRIHRPVDADGKTVAVGEYIVPVLLKNVENREIEVVYDTEAKHIIVEDGAAVGIEAEGKSGNKVTVNAKSVVIATGGFGANMDMVTKYKPELDGFVTTNGPGAQGQGITMGEEVGAATVDLEQIQIHPTVHVDEDGNPSLITEGVRGDGAILVNTNGERFFDETSTRDKVSAAELEQGEYVWLILDQKMLDDSALYDGFRKNGFCEEGKTLEELAKAIDVPAENLVATMEEWAKIYADKNDAEFGRTQFSAEHALDTAPYYAIKVAPGIHHTMGGLKINTNTEVLDTDGNVIPGLFAAGEVTGGVHGGNRLGGTAVTDITVFGQIAGKSAAEYAK